MFSTSIIELSRSALRKNYRFLRKITGRNTLLSSVIKGNAYGHGIEIFVPLAESCGIRHFSVFSADEAIRVVKVRTQPSLIMIMGALDNIELEWTIENDISFYVFGLDRMEAALLAAKRVNKPAKIHIELETGLNRMGLSGESLDRTIELIKDNPKHFIVEGVCTHFAGAESISNYLRIQNQISRYRKQTNNLLSHGIIPKMKHTACSAAALNYPETIMDMVRFGIAQYGFWPNKETQMQYYLKQQNEGHKRFADPLVRILKWKSQIINIKNVNPGEFVGYGTSYMATKPRKIASVPVGYYHGFSRDLSNQGRVLVHGRRAGVIGLVNMNMMMINVTDIPGVKIGDEVVLIGKQKKLQITVSSFSDILSDLNYEVLVSLHSDIPRVVVE